VVDEAWELLRERQPSVIRAKVLALRARSWTWVGEDRHDISELRGYLELAINDARQVGAASVEVDALVTLAAFAAQDAIELATAAAERAASLGAHEVELRALNNIAVAHLLDSRLREAVGVLDRICRRAEEVGLAWGTSSLSAHVSRVLVLFHLGDWSSALAAAELSGAPATAAAQVSAASLLVRAARGEYDDIDELAERIAHRGDSAVTGGLAAIAVAEAAQWRGRFQEAAEHANRALTRFGTLTRSAVVDELWAVVTGVSALADLAEQARRRHDHDVVRRVCEEGERLCAKRGGLRSRYPISQVGDSPEVRALTARLEAELSRLRGTDDVARWCRAVERAEDLRYWQAIARWRLAAARLAAGDRAAAGDEIRAVHAIAADLGAHPLADAVAKLARRARITLAGDEDPPSGPEEVLTPRELTVLELVASGLTNRQVGAELYISEKTASVHLSRVMAKLGATSRTEAVSLAYDRGLLS
jgi:DNA-binding CsgD family transcriptional regulator